MAVLAFVAGACAGAPPTPDSQRVDRLDLEGPKALSAGDIKEKIVTTESSWLPEWVPLLGHAGWFDPTSWQADLRRITRFYEANGFYQAHILEDLVTETKPGHVKLLVKLREGAPARVTSLRISGVPDGRADVLEGLPIREGDIFLEERWHTLKTLVAARLREAGYAETVVTGEALVNADAGKVELSVEVASGPRYHFGQVFVATDPGSKVPAKFIADQVSGELNRKDYFSESALGLAQARLFQLGVFAGVKVNRGAPEREAGEVPIVIDVREAPFRSLRVGGGVSADSIRQEVRGVLEYTDRNLGFARLFSKNALLDRLSVKTKLGVAFLPTIVSVVQDRPDAKYGPIGRILTEYEVPRVLGLKNVSLQSSLDLSRVLDTAFDYFGGDLKVGVLWRARPDLTVFPSVNLDTYFLRTPIELNTSAASAAVGCPTVPQACVIGFLDALVEFDRRDNRLEPTQGFYAALDVSAGLFQTNALTPFAKFVPEIRGYWSPDREHKFTIASKLRAGTLLAAGNETPIVARFFSGGSMMRGFNQRRLSPLTAVPSLVSGDTCRGTGQNTCFDYYHGAALPVGGQGLLEFSLEARWNFWGDFLVAVFTDWGLVTSKPLGRDTDFTKDLYAAVGFGFRYKLPIGPVRLDLALRVPGIGGPREVAQATTGRTAYFHNNGGCFGLGNRNIGNDAVAAAYSGAPEDSCNFHLTIGEAF